MPILPLRCSLCDRTERRVRRIIRAPRGILICNICVRAAVAILAEAWQMREMAYTHRRKVRRPR